MQVLDGQATRVEQIPLEGRLSVDPRVDVADQMSPLRQLSHHPHIKEINLLRSVHELSDCQTILRSDIVGGSRHSLVGHSLPRALDSKVLDQGLDARILPLEPLDQGFDEGALVLGWKVTRVQRKQGQRNIHDDLDDAGQLLFGQDV